jgi:uncharacterized protein YbbC (DUF1343 family)
MRKVLTALIVLGLVLLAGINTLVANDTRPRFKLGNEVLLERYRHLIEGKRVGLITNPTGLNSKGEHLVDILAADPKVQLTALYGPEHGLDGKAAAGDYVESYQHPTLHIPVYSLYGATRKPTAAMLQDVDVLLFDIQDIGARYYTFISTMNYAMQAAQENGKQFIVLDRPNPLGGEIVEGPMLEDYYATFVGVDNLPMAHGMTIGELARFFNRKIGVDLTVVPMEGYTRDMIWQDTGLTWVPTSPMIPTVEAAFGYMASGLGDGTGIGRGGTYFSWIGGKGIDSVKFAKLMNGAGLPGVRYHAEDKGSQGGVRIEITDYRTFNPAKSGIYALAYARSLNQFAVPKSGNTPSQICMFDKLMGSNKVGQWLEQNLSPQQIVARYTPELNRFRQERQAYLIYGYLGKAGQIPVIVNNTPIYFDSAPFIDENSRTMVPARAIAEALGCTVEWNQATQKVTLTRGMTVISLTIGKKSVSVNGVVKELDTQPVLRYNRTMLPVRFIGEAVGAEVVWDGVHRQVWISGD